MNHPKEEKIHLPSLPDASRWLLYDETAMDTRKTLWFVADAQDVTALDNQNAMCLAYGAGFKNFRDAEPFLSSFPSVFLALSDRDTAEAVADALKEYAPSVAVLLPKEGAFGKCSRIRDVLASGGRKAVDHLLLGAVEQPMDGLLDLADVERRDPGASVAVMSGLKALDQSIGGFAPSELSVWTGKRGSGKSTLLSQLLLNAIDQGFPVCAYSGELSAWRFKQWAMLQAAGAGHIEPKRDPVSGKLYYYTPKEIADRIDGWWKGKFFLYDNRVAGAGDEDSIISVFEYAVRRFGCCVFLVDNLMTARFSDQSDKDFYRAQSRFTGRLVEFAKKNEVHVHLVAHPRKGDNDKKKLLTADDIGGSADITNRADNAFSLERIEEKDIAAYGYDAGLSILKNRSYGSTANIQLVYDARCRRYTKKGESDGVYGWER